MNKPFFTVVIPTHNRSDLLKRAVDSVLKQTFEAFEVIVVDDHSTDDTDSVINSFSDTRIRYFINNRTKGACGARNTGIFASKAEWIAFLDDDDIWLPDKLKDQYEKIQNVEATVGLVCSGYAIFKSKEHEPLIIKNNPSGWVRDKLLFGGIIGCLSSVCIKTDILKAIEGFDVRFPSNQDQDLYLRVAELAEFAHVPRTLVHIYQERRDRIGANSKSKLDGYVMLRDKYATEINRNLLLRHRYESHIFTYAFLQKNRSLVAKCLPWVFLGSVIDLPNFLRTIRTTVLLFTRTKNRARLSQKKI